MRRGASWWLLLLVACACAAGPLVATRASEPPSTILRAGAAGATDLSPARQTAAIGAAEALPPAPQAGTPGAAETAPAAAQAPPALPPPSLPPPPSAERGRLRGEVIFTRQEPAVGAAVILIKEGDSSRLAVGTTDNHGYFRFESIPAGTYTVGIVKEGASVVLKTGIVVKPPVRSIVDIVLKKEPGRWTAPLIDLGKFEQWQANQAAARAAASGAGAHEPRGSDDPAAGVPRSEAGGGAGATGGGSPAAADVGPTGNPTGAGRATAPPAATGTSPGPSEGAATAGAVAGGPAGNAAQTAAAASGGAAAPPGSAAPSPNARMVVQVLDVEMKPVREARVVLRSRGPLVNPRREVTDGLGVATLQAPEAGEYLFRVSVPGFLPVRVDRLILGHTPPRVYVVLNPRPLDYPASPGELLPEEKPVPPQGFPGAPESKPSS